MSAGRHGARSLPWLAAVALAVTLVAPLLARGAGAAAQPSIYEHIRTHIDPATGTLRAEAVTLPDEPATRRLSRMRWAPGALEGLGTRHVQWDGSEKAVRAVALLEAIADGDASAEAALYELLRADDVVMFYGPALDLAAARIRDVEPTLHALALRLATTARDRGPVKFGIAMLGSIGDERDAGIVQTLALHDEFGLYAAEALAELAPDRQRALFEMARKVTGWGRIEAVTTLVATSDPELRHWLLTEGFRNDVSPQYLAYHCATIADLSGALSAEPGSSRTERREDTQLLEGAAVLIQTLVKPGPSQSFDDYADAQQVATRFLERVKTRRDSISFLLAAGALEDYAGTKQWDPAQHQQVQQLAASIAGDPVWRKRVSAALSDDRADLEQAELAARKLGVRTFDLHLRRLEKNGALAQRWKLAFAAAEPRQIEPLLNTAGRTFGARFARNGAPGTPETDAALEAVLQGVGRYPGSGIPIVDAALLDESLRVRRAAVETLVRWGGPFLREASVQAALNAAARDETDEALKARMVALLNVGALP